MINNSTCNLYGLCDFLVLFQSSPYRGFILGILFPHKVFLCRTAWWESSLLNLNKSFRKHPFWVKFLGFKRFLLIAIFLDKLKGCIVFLRNLIDLFLAWLDFWVCYCLQATDMEAQFWLSNYPARHLHLWYIGFLGGIPSTLIIKNFLSLGPSEGIIISSSRDFVACYWKYIGPFFCCTHILTFPLGAIIIPLRLISFWLHQLGGGASILPFPCCYSLTLPSPILFHSFPSLF